MQKFWKFTVTSLLPGQTQRNMIVRHTKQGICSDHSRLINYHHNVEKVENWFPYLFCLDIPQE